MRKTNRKTRIAIVAAAAAAALLALTGCTTDADMVSKNVSQAAESFEVQRTIVGINGITGDTIFYAEGRCSFEYPSASRFDVTCKYGPDKFRKHTFILGDQDSVVVTQEKDIDADEYHTRIILKPENLIPAFDLQVGEEG